MTTSQLFHTGAHRQIERAILDLVNEQPDFLSARTAASPRSAGDAVQHLLSEQLRPLLGTHCSEYVPQFKRRGMGDLAFTDPQGLYYLVDVKTHRLDAELHMPNITSVDRLARFYERDSNYFIVLMVDYRLASTRLEAVDVHFVPVEFLSWDCLTIGALGIGQLQIAGGRRLQIDDRSTRRSWMLELCRKLLDFYPREIAKIEKRRQRFAQVEEAWRNRPE